MLVQCPSCGAQNDDRGSSCKKCGKPLPTEARRSEARRLAVHWVAGVLFVIAGVFLLYNLIILRAALEDTSPKTRPDIIIGFMVPVVALFNGLGFWALYKPAVAGCVGLFLFIFLVIMEAALMPPRGGGRSGVILSVALALTLARGIVLAVRAK